MEKQIRRAMRDEIKKMTPEEQQQLRGVLCEMWPVLIKGIKIFSASTKWYVRLGVAIALAILEPLHESICGGENPS